MIGVTMFNIKVNDMNGNHVLSGYKNKRMRTINGQKEVNMLLIMIWYLLTKR